jgi:hypothetical protein
MEIQAETHKEKHAIKMRVQCFPINEVNINFETWKMKPLK